MKRKVKRITLNRETLRSLDAEELANVAGASHVCPPQSYGSSCVADCPVEPFSTGCA
jgi:hypothetical protein